MFYILVYVTVKCWIYSPACNLSFCNFPVQSHLEWKSPLVQSDVHVQVKKSWSWEKSIRSKLRSWLILNNNPAESYLSERKFLILYTNIYLLYYRRIIFVLYDLWPWAYFVNGMNYLIWMRISILILLFSSFQHKTFQFLDFLITLFHNNRFNQK